MGSGLIRCALGDKRTDDVCTDGSDTDIFGLEMRPESLGKVAVTPVVECMVVSQGVGVRNGSDGGGNDRTGPFLIPRGSLVSREKVGLIA